VPQDLWHRRFSLMHRQENELSAQQVAGVG